MGGMTATRFSFFYPETASHLIIVNQIGLEDARLQRPEAPDLFYPPVLKFLKGT
jgi:hypothetical protein